MSALNGRLLPRRVFGAPLTAVILTAAVFLLIVILLLPVKELNLLRPFVLVSIILMLMRIRELMKQGHLIVILSALAMNKKIRRAKRPYE